MSRRSVVRDCLEVFPRTLPVMFGYVALGMAYALVSKAQGFPPLVPLILSVIVYSGAIQFLTIQLFAAMVSVPALILTTLVVQGRHLAYGLSMLPFFRGAGWRKPYLAYALTDETFAILSTTEPPGTMPLHRYQLLVTALNQFYWVLGTALGIILGEVLPVSTKGADFALTALFIVLTLEQWKAGAKKRLFAIGLGSALLMLWILGPDNMLLPAVLLAVIAILLNGHLGKRPADQWEKTDEGSVMGQSAEGPAVDPAADPAMGTSALDPAADAASGASSGEGKERKGGPDHV